VTVVVAVVATVVVVATVATVETAASLGMPIVAKVGKGRVCVVFRSFQWVDRKRCYL
jgi:hypothetical protein